MLEVGQTLWFVDQHSYRPVGERGHAVTITKIGRKWATTSHGLRVDKDTLAADGGNYSSPGRCYPSQDAYRAELARTALWRDVMGRISQFHAPDGVSVETIKQIAELLGVPLNT